MSSLVLDYVLRMKVSANINWFYAESLPLPEWDQTPFEAEAATLVRSLNAIGEDFGTAKASVPLLDGGERMAARLLIDALVADLYNVSADDLAHIAEQFPTYDRGAPAELRYPRLAVLAYEAMISGGIDEARNCATALVEERRAVGCGFGFDELWQPEGGWEQANTEARAILEEAGVR